MSRTGPHGVLARLTVLDPARHHGGRASAGDATLQQIMDTPRQPRSDDLVPRRGSGPAAAAVLVAVVLALGVVIWSMSGPVAYATWTSTPQQVSDQRARTAATQCPQVVHEITGDGDQAMVEQVPVDPVLIDIRGDHTYVISADARGRYAECFVTSNGQPDVVASEAGLDPGATALAQAPDGGIQVLHAGTASWSQGADGLPGELTSAFGRSGEDVVQVVVHTEAGEAVRASVQQGWWAAWAPGGDSFTGVATVTFADGTTSQEELDIGAR